MIGIVIEKHLVDEFQQDAFMKDLTTRFIAAMTFAAIALGTSSCIYDAPGDNFYRTLWKSSPEALGQFDTGAIKVEFLCDNKITVRDGTRIIAYGNYISDDDVAIFSGLQTILEGYEVTFFEAHRSGDTLFLLWYYDGVNCTFTTSLGRLSAYE